MPLKIAVVGTGPVARDYYIPFLKSQSDVELAYFNRTHDTARSPSPPSMAERPCDRSRNSRRGSSDAALLLVAETARHACSGIQNSSKLWLSKKSSSKTAGRHEGPRPMSPRMTSTKPAQTSLNLAAAQHCDTAMVFNYRFFEPVQNPSNASPPNATSAKSCNATALVH